MSEFNKKDSGSELPTPSAMQLLKSTAIALVVAIVLLLTVIIPAEYGVDPTGVGRILGLKEMGEMKADFEQEKHKDHHGHEVSKTDQNDPTKSSESSLIVYDEEKEEVLSLVLGPNQSTEVKLEMLEGNKVYFYWTANGSALNYDLHGDPYNAPTDFYHSYEKGKGVAEQKGELYAAFSGLHGWYWRNRTEEPVKVTLEVKGQFFAIKQL
ncbi:transmembrane anchor protein [Vibrio sp. Of7-15]|uniref:transmembrane anchor protein n=1 Tax=Vibrio sp. Of7-15 TaxID=2724879 RepID=UPI001EF1E96C|nr:transmembrane anchor protein [Vibrio sp. Of7-15]MCG7495282.1 transmembrane anchor protein [Vibrio sp. Of7-15]